MLMGQEKLCDCCAEIASSTPPAEPSAQQFAKRPPEGEKLIKPPAQVEHFVILYSFVCGKLPTNTVADNDIYVP